MEPTFSRAADWIQYLSQCIHIFSSSFSWSFWLKFNKFSFCEEQTATFRTIMYQPYFLFTWKKHCNYSILCKYFITKLSFWNLILIIMILGMQISLNYLRSSQSLDLTYFSFNGVLFRCAKRHTLWYYSWLNLLNLNVSKSCVTSFL